MTFEEKYAAHGRKLDELKAKLDAAVEARKLAQEKKCKDLEAALDEFDAALDAQIDKQFDTLDAQAVKQCDTMVRRVDMLDAQIEKQYDTLDAQAVKQCDTLDAQIGKQCDTMARRVDMLDAQIEKQYDTLDEQALKQCGTLDAQINKQLDTMGERVEKLDAAIEDQAEKAKAAFTLDKATAEAIASEPTGIGAVQKLAAGDFAAAEENARLIRERRDAKCSAARLRTEMKVNAAKEKVAERREARDKAAEEQWIFDLLEYAEGCYEMALAWALEAEYTLMEADYEMDYYCERFGSGK